MATARVRCPACNTELEIDARHLGEEVECGSCLKVFVAERPPTSTIPAAEQPPVRRSRRPRRDDDDDDYTPARVPAEGGGGTSTAAVLSLVFGILSLTTACCWCSGPPAAITGIVCGIIGMQTPQSKGLAVAGLALSVFGLLAFGGFQLAGIAGPLVGLGN